jgi:hypothetical protein
LYFHDSRRSDSIVSDVDASGVTDVTGVTNVTGVTGVVTLSSEMSSFQHKISLLNYKFTVELESVDTLWLVTLLATFPSPSGLQASPLTRGV